MDKGYGLWVGMSACSGLVTNFMSDAATVTLIGPIVVPMGIMTQVAGDRYRELPKHVSPDLVKYYEVLSPFFGAKYLSTLYRPDHDVMKPAGWPHVGQSLA